MRVRQADTIPSDAPVVKTWTPTQGQDVGLGARKGPRRVDGDVGLVTRGAVESFA